MTAPVQINETSTDGTASANTLGIAQGSNPVVGHTNLVWVRNNSGITVLSVADTLGHTYTARGSVAEAGTGALLSQFTAPITSSGANTVTATYSASTTNRGIAVVEVAGTYDASATGTDTGSNPTPTVSASNSAQPATVYGLCNDIQNGTPTVGTGFTNVGTGWVTSLAPFRAQYKEVTVVGSNGVNFGNSGFDRNNTGVIILLDLPTGPTITTQPQGIAGNVGDTPAFTYAATTSGGSMTAQGQNSNNGETWADISGATGTTTYTVPALNANDNGKYFRVKFTDTNGTTTSEPARVWVSGLSSTGKGRKL